eukprot:scaffold3570_cov227-Amphora_coffeaeformis.AAC.4
MFKIFKQPQRRRRRLCAHQVINPHKFVPRSRPLERTILALGEKNEVNYSLITSREVRSWKAKRNQGNGLLGMKRMMTERRRCDGDATSYSASLQHQRVSASKSRVFLGASLGLVFLLCIVPYQTPRTRSLSPTVVEDKTVRGALEPAITIPEVISYPDANQTRPQGRDRPYFILHVGPPKSATTTLQTEMSKYGEYLREDNYAYLGQLMKKDAKSIFDHWHGPVLRALKNRECQRKVNRARLNGYEWPDCWKNFLGLLKARRDEGRSIIYSEEDFAIKFVGMQGGMGRSPIDWPSLQMALEEQDWEPVIIVGYRRLYEIMPSAKQQWDQWTPNSDLLVKWPPEGRTLQPLFPDVLSDPRLYDDYEPKWVPRTIQWSYTDHLVRMISPYLPVRLLNMHDPLSIRSTFLCRVIPHAPNACRQSQIDDAEQEELHRNEEQSLFYDRIATEAADRKWFDKSKFSRHQVGLALRDYFENERESNPHNLPLICPNATQLESLLERSLTKEQQILTPQVAESMRDEHIAGFWKAVTKNKFCWIDVNKTLEDPHWRQFFSEIVPADEYEEKNGEENYEYDAEKERK